jgi:hypothetical protein
VREIRECKDARFRKFISPRGGRWAGVAKTGVSYIVYLCGGLNFHGLMVVLAFARPKFVNLISRRSWEY